ncbi:ABC transporter substrate-binding protein [Rhodococcus sp. P-2]|uniref:ABC transporter substrate-binding protein n=1 Tax=Rhodococcus sp. P-2 TaxID=2795031 RepID=UPI0019062058|nr:ABC transporter substrate-binding protein [Rhodococcus sp. P-2]QQM24482.1 ABC transporter substrate-binding protein [Rhodococcus sp. P-2]
MTPLLLPTPDTDAEFARITAALTRRGFLGGSAAALSMLALAGCGSGDAGGGADGETRTVQTHYGPVDVPVDPQRIVAVSYNTPWQLQAVGAQPVATLDYSAYIDQFTPAQQKFIDGLSSVGVFLEVNREAVVAAAPDLIVGDAYEIDEDMFRELSKIAPTAVYSGTNRSDWRTVAEGVADAVNKGSALTSNREKYQAMQERIRTEYSAQLRGNRWAQVAIGGSEGLFSILYPTGVTGAMLADLDVTRGEFIPDLNPSTGFEAFPFEQLEMLRDVTVVIYPKQPDGTDSAGMKSIFANPLWSRIPAIASGQSFGISTQVTDYGTAINWLSELESGALEALS